MSSIDQPSRKKAPRQPGESTLYRIRAAASAKNGKALAWATLAGCMIFLSYPDYDLFPLQWFALIPLLHVIHERRPRGAFGWGFWAGLVTNWGGFYWVTGMLMDFGHFSLSVAIPICTLMCAYQGLAMGIWAGLTRWITLYTGASLLWVAPLVWAAVETIVPFIFPWYMGNGQYRFSTATQIVEVTGVTGVTFILVFVNAGLFLTVQQLRLERKRQAALTFGATALLFLANVTYGFIRIGQVEAMEAAASHLRIGMGEADVGIFEKEAKGLRSFSEKFQMLRGNIMKHHLLAAELEKKHQVDLVVLPESSFIPVPPPYAWLEFKRSDSFAVAASSDGSFWSLEGDVWQRFGRAPDERRVRALASTGDHAILAVGERGLVARAEKGDWKVEDSGTTQALNGLWVGEPSVELTHLDGAPWFAMAVGDGGVAVVREDGKWRATDSLATVDLAAVDAVDAMRGWAVGQHGTILGWHGDGFVREKADTLVDLYDVWVGSSEDVVAVGAQGAVLTRTEGAWTKQSITDGALRAVASHGERVFVAGDAGAVFERQSGTWRKLSVPTNASITAMMVDGRSRSFVAASGGEFFMRDGAEVPWKALPKLGPGVAITTLTAVPFTLAQAYARDSKWVGISREPLPDAKGTLTELVVDVKSRVLPEDDQTAPEDWNVPMRGFTTPVLLGLLTYDAVEGEMPMAGRDSRRTYNSAMLIDGEGKVLGRYDKNYLLVFGEYIPFGEKFPQLYEWLPEASHFYAGETVEAFPFKGHRLGVMICYEDILPRFTRRLAGQDPNVLINVTNDAWFGRTSEPYHHLALATFRSIENRLWMVRSTNTGVSAFVDAAGRIVSQTKLTDPEVLVEDVPMLETTTIYRRFGDWFGIACSIGFFALTVQAFMIRRRSRIRGTIK